MSEITIETLRLELRTMQPTDLEDLLKIFGDPKVMASFSSPPFEREQMESWLNRNLAHQEQYGYGLFSVIHKGDQILIGNCGLEHMEMEGVLAAELGYDFRSDYWNQGYATEAAAGVRDYAFKTLALPFLISLIRVGNGSSKRVAEKIGMQLQTEIAINGIAYWRYFIPKDKLKQI
jgi:ribosomal-protein-alanine N-acetyltransferase